MPKPSLAQYSIAELEDYIKARKIIAQYESVPAVKGTIAKPSKVKAKTTRSKRRAPINAADVVAVIKKAGTEGITGTKLQKALDTSYPTFTKWMEEHAKDNNIHKSKREKGKGAGNIFTVKS